MLRASNLAQSCNQIVTGAGLKREKVLALRDFHLDSDGATLTITLSTNPGWIKAGTNMTVLSWAASKVVVAGFDFTLPADYDKTNDYLKLKLKFKMAGSTDTPTVAVAAYADSAPTTDLAPTALTALSDTATWKEIVLSSNGLEAGDVIHLAITPGTHGTDAIEVYGNPILEYKSDLVAYDVSVR